MGISLPPPAILPSQSLPPFLLPSLSLSFPPFSQNEYIYSYKQARRREDDIAIVNAGLRVLLSPSDPHWLVEECSLSYGGMSYITVAATETQKALVGK